MAIFENGYFICLLSLDRWRSIELRRPRASGWAAPCWTVSWLRRRMNCSFMHLGISEKFTYTLTADFARYSPLSLWTPRTMVRYMKSRKCQTLETTFCQQRKCLRKKWEKPTLKPRFPLQPRLRGKCVKVSNSIFFQNGRTACFCDRKRGALSWLYQHRLSWSECLCRALSKSTRSHNSSKTSVVDQFSTKM